MADIAQSGLYKITGILPKDACVVIVRTEWNADIIDELENGCRNFLEASGIKKIITLNVPGSIEIPYIINQYWNYTQSSENKPDAFIALGCVIRGETPHFDYVCMSVTQGITSLNISLPVPVIFGILTVDNIQQANERLGGFHGHKGEEAAITAIKMIALKRSFI